MHALLLLIETCFPSLWSQPLPSHAPAYLDSLPPHDLVISTDVFVPTPFGKCGAGVLANCSLCGTDATIFFHQAQYAQVFPLKSASFCKLFAGLGSTNKSYISLLFSVFPCTLISRAHLAGTVFSFFQFYQATMGPWTFVSTGN